MLLTLAAPAVCCREEHGRHPEEQGRPAVVDLSGNGRYSHGREELIIRDFFQDRRGGVFLDVGAASPIKFSNTYYLERHLGWSGIAVDALAEYAIPWKRKRPRSRFFAFLVTDHADTEEPFYRATLPGISAAQRPRVGPGGNEVPVEEIPTPTITLTALLERNGVSGIDLLSLDIEGGELTALAGFDIDRFRPELVCVEAKPVNHQKLLAYFAAHGYERIDRYLEYDRTNFYFTPTSGRAGR